MNSSLVHRRVVSSFSALKKVVYVAGHQGMVGSAIVRKLEALGDAELVTANRSDLDLINHSAVMDFFASHQIDEVYLAAAKVGGIYANEAYPAEFIYQNLMVQSNVVHAAHLSGVQKLMFLGSSCIYPREVTQPMREDALLTAGLEPTNEPYAIAKIAGIKLCESYNRQYGRDYRSVMPTNLYGPNDNFHPENSHVIPGLMRRLHEAAVRGDQIVTIWGSGTPKREFLHVDDMAAACVYVMNLDTTQYLQHTQPRLSHINVGTGVDCTIRELAETIAKVTGFAGQLVFDTSKPDGTARKLLDVSRLESVGFKSSISLEMGLRDTYSWFLKHQGKYRG